MTRLLAISDLHVNRPSNRDAVDALRGAPGDWLLLGGDIGDGPEDLDFVLERMIDRFERVLWVPGNHELWWRRPDEAFGVERYADLIELCQGRGVLTPEDPWPVWTGPGGPVRVAPLFVGYDYTFGGADVPAGRDAVCAWAAEDGIYATDERLLRTDPYPDMAAWCADRVALTEARLEAATDLPLVLLNHYPLRHELVRFGRIRRYLPWCGTAATRDWHTRFPVRVSVHGHLHMRATDWVDGVRFEEVALGYPQHWRQDAGAATYLREILPGRAHVGCGGPVWHP